MTREKESKITVGMTAYNAAPFIEEAINSALNQTHSNFEFIIYNDGSTDSTSHIVEHFSDKRIQFIDEKQNRGVSAARQIIKQNANGDWLTWLDADDIYFPNRLEILLSYALKHQSDLVTDAYEVIDSNGTSLHTYLETPDYLAEDNHYTRLFERNRMLPHPLISRRCYESVDYDTSLPTSEDYDYWLKCVVKGFRFSKISDVLMRYRMVPGSLSSDNARSRKYTQIIFAKYEVEDIIRLYRLRGYPDELVNYMATLQYLFREKKKNALEYANKPWLTDNDVSREFYLGSLLLHFSELEDAETALKRHLHEFPNSPAGWNNYGVLQFMRGTDYVTSFKKAVALFPMYEDAHANLADPSLKRITFTQLSDKRIR
ncbi:MAG: glycosyltransferase [Deltaproteobacteria bacterium]|nr:glycosyltransferase [Deltaproteobacteria bacterium]MBN2674613.1 glycosyltransferase [Deltaproteobacteria bacterium]